MSSSQSPSDAPQPTTDKHSHTNHTHNHPAPPANPDSQQAKLYQHSLMLQLRRQPWWRDSSHNTLVTHLHQCHQELLAQNAGHRQVLAQSFQGTLSS